MPGAGKSTVSRLLAANLPRAARIAADDLNAMVLAGAVWPLGQPAEEAARQVELSYRNLAALAKNFTDAGREASERFTFDGYDELDETMRRGFEVG